MEFSPELFKVCMSYCPETGLLTWRERPPEHFKLPHIHKAWNTRRAGKPALNAMTGFGYRAGLLFGKTLRAHRAAWAIHTGEMPDVIDHINGNRADNRIANLRSVSAIENRRNQKIPSHNTSGVIGVTWNKQFGLWAAIITVDGRNILLGRFADKADAVIARAAGEVKYGFHKNHGREK